jgi:alkylated DNA nucleotide flippase Atl1
MRAEYVEAVLDVAELIPPGQVLSYGDIAVLLERGGPRQVGSVMSHHGSAVAWWRVIRAGGQPPQGHDAAALVHYRGESTALRGDTAVGKPGERPVEPCRIGFFAH